MLEHRRSAHVIGLDDPAGDAPSRTSATLVVEPGMTWRSGGPRSAAGLRDPGCRVGMPPAKNSASAATSAMTASAARSARSRAFGVLVDDRRRRRRR